MKLLWLFIFSFFTLAQAADVASPPAAGIAPPTPPSFIGRLTPQQQARMAAFLQRKAAMDALKQQSQQQVSPAKKHRR